MRETRLVGRATKLVRRAMGHGGGDRARVLAVLTIATALGLGLLAGPASAHNASKSVWLCLPGRTPDPCTAPLTTTVVQTNGETSVEHARPARRPPINCFYVYPTVSEQPGENANLEIEPEETQIAIEQASRFSQDCRVYAPMYPQITLAALNGGPVSLAAQLTAYLGVVKAFHEFLAKFDKGRGFVLIGHSQGAILLTQLIGERIDPDPALRHLLVSALLMGANVLVPEGKLVGGSFKSVPECQAAAQTHCVIAYSTFLKEPPEGAFFGRPDSPLLGGGEHKGMQVVCVNPTLPRQNGAAGALLPYAPTTPFPGQLGAYLPTPTGPTPWVAAPGVYSAQCHYENGASWLQVNPVGTPVDPPEYVQELLGPEWGLHLFDISIALGNLVRTVAVQSLAYGLEGVSAEPAPAPASASG
jgi:hypothetical protein